MSLLPGKSYRNLITGIVGQVITLGLGMIVPRLMIVNYGSEVNGLLSSVVQIFAYFSLFEAGIGAVALQALYRAHARGSKHEINSILSALNINYKKIGFLYIVSSLILAFSYSLFVESEIPYKTVFCIILLNAIAPVTSFYFQKKYLLLLQAEGKLYITNTISLVSLTLANLCKLFFISAGFDIVIVQCFVTCATISQMLFVAIYISKHYKWIDFSVKPDLNSIKQSKNAFVHQISALIFNNSDIILLSLFTSLKIVSVFAMYSLLFGIVKTFITQINSSVEYILGQRFHVSKTPFFKLHETYEMLFICCAFTLFTTASFFVPFFLRLYTFGVEDIDYLLPYIPELFLIVCLLSYVRIPTMQVIQFASHFKQTQYRSICEASLKLICGLFFVNYFGIYGILLANIVSLLYRSNDIIIYAYNVILKASPIRFYKFVSINILCLIVIIFLSSRLDIKMDTYAEIILFSVPYFLSCALIYATIVYIFNKDIRKYVHLFFFSKVRY